MYLNHKTFCDGSERASLTLSEKDKEIIRMEPVGSSLWEVFGPKFPVGTTFQERVDFTPDWWAQTGPGRPRYGVTTLGQFAALSDFSALSGWADFIAAPLPANVPGVLRLRGPRRRLSSDLGDPAVKAAIAAWVASKRLAWLAENAAENEQFANRQALTCRHMESRGEQGLFPAKGRLTAA